MAWLKKDKDAMWIVRETDLDTYGSFTTMNESVHICDRKEDALEYSVVLAESFEKASELIGNVTAVRLADDPECRILISREFGISYPIIRERRIIVEAF